MAVSSCRMLPPDEAARFVRRLDLEPLRRRDSEWDTITAFDLFEKALRDEIAVIVHDSGGWMLLRTYAGEPPLQRGLHVWAVHAFAPGAFAEGGEYLAELAREVGADCITFGSDRKGWEKIAPRLGYNRQSSGEYLKVLRDE